MACSGFMRVPLIGQGTGALGSCSSASPSSAVGAAFLPAGSGSASSPASSVLVPLALAALALFALTRKD